MNTITGEPDHQATVIRIMEATMKNDVLNSVRLPMGAQGAFDNAKIEVKKLELDPIAEPFFGGYAEDFLEDAGFAEVSEAEVVTLKKSL